MVSMQQVLSITPLLWEEHVRLPCCYSNDFPDIIVPRDTIIMKYYLLFGLHKDVSVLYSIFNAILL